MSFWRSAKVLLQMRNGLSQSLTLLSAALFVALPFAPAWAGSPTFPEERPGAPLVWRNGCADWLDEAPLNAPAIRILKDSGRLWASASFTLPPEPGESTDDVYKSALAALGDGRHYPEWVLPGINERADGGNYFVTLKGLNVLEPVPGVHFLLTGPYVFEVLWFRREGASTLEMRREETREWPDCPGFRDRRPGNDATTLFKYRMTPRPEILESLLAEVRVTPRGVGAEVRLRLAARPSRLVYELMSESMVRTQVEQRGLRIYSNFLDYRRADFLKRRSDALSKKDVAAKAPKTGPTRAKRAAPKAKEP